MHLNFHLIHIHIFVDKFIILFIMQNFRYIIYVIQFYFITFKKDKEEMKTYQDMCHLPGA